MSYIDELRERFLAAEQRFGRINEAGRDYRDRLMGLMSRIEEEIRCRRDVEQQQAQEIERLSSEVDRISGENEQLRTMMMSLLTAVEAGDTDSLGGTLNEMDTKVAALIGEGQGAAMSAQTAEQVGETPDFTAELADDLSDELEEEEAFSAPSFPAGDMMSQPSDEPPFSGEDADFDHSDGSGSDELVAEEAAVAEEAPEAEEDDMPGAVDAAPDAVEPTPVDSASDVTSDMAEFYGSDDRADVDAVPAYSHAVAGWEDFLDDDGTSTEGSASPDETQSAVSEVSDDFVGEDAGDPEAGSIHELIDRVKTVVDGEDDAPDAEAGADETVSLDSDDDDDKAAAQ